MDFPAAADTDAKRGEFAYRAIEKLRLVHKQKAKEMPLEEFRVWQRTVWQPKSQEAFRALNEVRNLHVEGTPEEMLAQSEAEHAMKEAGKEALKDETKERDFQRDIIKEGMKVIGSAK